MNPRFRKESGVLFFRVSVLQLRRRIEVAARRVKAWSGKNFGEFSRVRLSCRHPSAAVPPVERASRGRVSAAGLRPTMTERLAAFPVAATVLVRREWTPVPWLAQRDCGA